MISGLRVLVLGVGVAGTSTVAACRDLGATAVTVDANGEADHLTVDELDLTQFDVVMASAAFAPHSAAIRACEAVPDPSFVVAVQKDRASVDALRLAVKAIVDFQKADFLTLLDLELPKQLEGDND